MIRKQTDRQLSKNLILDIHAPEGEVERIRMAVMDPIRLTPDGMEFDSREMKTSRKEGMSPSVVFSKIAAFLKQIHLSGEPHNAPVIVSWNLHRHDLSYLNQGFLEYRIRPVLRNDYMIDLSYWAQDWLKFTQIPNFQMVTVAKYAGIERENSFELSKAIFLYFEHSFRMLSIKIGKTEEPKTKNR